MKELIELSSVTLGMIGTGLLAKKHILGPRFLWVSYALFFVFAVLNGHWITAGSTTVKIVLTTITNLEWGKDS